MDSTSIYKVGKHHLTRGSLSDLAEGDKLVVVSFENGDQDLIKDPVSFTVSDSGVLAITNPENHNTLRMYRSWRSVEAVPYKKDGPQVW